MDDTSAGRYYPCMWCGENFPLPADPAEGVEWILDHWDEHGHETTGPLAQQLREQILDVKIDFKQLCEMPDFRKAREHPDWPKSMDN